MELIATLAEINQSISPLNDQLQMIIRLAIQYYTTR